MPTKENSSVRSAIEGERNIQGFFTAYLSVNAYYLTAPEVELNHGYCDLFLMPDLLHYEVNHSYIIELKYLSEKDSDAKAEIQWEEAVEQIKGLCSRTESSPIDTEYKVTLHCDAIPWLGTPTNGRSNSTTYKMTALLPSRSHFRLNPPIHRSYSD